MSLAKNCARGKSSSCIPLLREGHKIPRAYNALNIVSVEGALYYERDTFQSRQYCIILCNSHVEEKNR